MKKSKQSKKQQKEFKKLLKEQGKQFQRQLSGIGDSYLEIIKLLKPIIEVINSTDAQPEIIKEVINSTDAQPAVIYEQPKRTTKRLNSDEIKKRCEHLFIKGYIVLGEIDNQEIYSNTGRLCIHTSKKIHFNNADMTAQSINFQDYIAYWNGLGKTLQRNAIADNQKTATYKPAKLISPLTVKKVAVKG